MNRKRRALSMIVVILAGLLFPVVGWFYLGSTMPAIRIRSVAPNGSIITCAPDGTCVYENTIDIFSPIAGSNAWLGPLQIAFFVGAFMGGFAVALILVSYSFFLREEQPGMRKTRTRSKETEHAKVDR